MLDMSGNTVEAVRLALNVASIQQQLAAYNIANVNSPGHVAVRADFSTQLSAAREAVASGRTIDGAVDPSLIRWMATTTPTGTTPGGVQLDQEAALLSQTTLLYQALTKALSRHLQIIAVAVSEGRR